MSQTVATSLRTQKYLKNIALSPALAALKAAAQVQLDLTTTDESVNAAATDQLADAVSELPGTLACHMDLMRLLHGKAVQHTRHRRANLAAVLRDRARRLGRPPVAEDFPADHPIHVFALPYWGGVAAWSAGSADRVQHRKGYWGDRQNQIEALRLAVARHPNVPITHTLLRAAGLHRMAVVLDAAQLALLAGEAGVKRSLLYRPAAWWTPERVIDAYAAQCRLTGATLSTSALTAIGGEASSLRVYARRHFGSFRDFQAEVTKRHPEIHPPERPIAADGTCLDSWSEVPAYNAIRAALPDVQIQVHVVLPGEKRRWAKSGDFLIDGRLWVEVLGLSLDGMEVASTGRQRKYASQWTAKRERYRALGVTPLIIEPSDIYDPQRLGCRIAEIAEQLGREPPAAQPRDGRSMRAKGTWTFEALCQAVAEVAGPTGMLPTYTALTAAGYGHAAQLLRAPGERQRVAATLGLRDKYAKGVWTQARVVDELAAWVHKHGGFPTRADLRRSGLGALSSAAERLWTGDRAGLQAAVTSHSGISVRLHRAANGSLETQDQLVAALRPLADRLGRMPSCKEAAAAGLSTAWARASRTIGVTAMAKLVGLPSIGPQRRSRAEMLRDFADLESSIKPARLTTTIIREAMGAGGLARLRKCGGIASVRAVIGRLSSRDGQGE